MIRAAPKLLILPLTYASTLYCNVSIIRVSSKLEHGPWPPEDILSGVKQRPEYVKSTPLVAGINLTWGGQVIFHYDQCFIFVSIRISRWRTFFRVPDKAVVFREKKD